MKTPLRTGEKVVKEGAASLQVNIETEGGRLYLTNQRLVFESQALNAQSGTAILELEQVLTLEKRWTKLFDAIPIFPNTLAVLTAERAYAFVLERREEWSAAIARQVQLGKTSPKIVPSVSEKPTESLINEGVASKDNAPSNDVLLWFYEENGERKGPVTEAQIIECIQLKQLYADSSLWTSGLTEWKKLERTKFSQYLDKTVPPPLDGSLVNNTIVWILAFAPVIGEFLEGFVAGVVYQNAYLATLAQKQGKFWYVTVILNIVLALMDERKLQAAGHDTQKFRMWAWLLVPVYLFQRAKFMQQSLAYFIVWCVSFGVAILFM